MFKSILVANRGEIACRVFRTARAMGLRTIAVYSEADAKAPHVRMAHEAVLLGPAQASESYLDGAKVLAAARATGAEAIHPGYGFLSENADFAEAVKAAGLVWIGPPPASIRAMGLKDAAKKLMIEAGVPVTPGYQGEDQAADTLKAEADRIGYPVLIKAVAGGGGKGMRRVDRSEDFADALASAQREGQSSFGDPRVLIETYITRPRHIEVQVFGDTHGTVVHLNERDCSLQRRHQKVIEEAPAPGMDAETREAVTAAAVRAAQAVNYEGAGTIEFIADASEGLRADRIWFMEMNTRLQVEHPVTEAITGVDLVEWQLRVAAGEPIPLKQDEIGIHGWAMEARLYAEDPANGFLPSIGRLEHFRMPDSVRVDTGVEQGGEVSQFYDPMIAKLITWAPTREEAADLQVAALDAFEIEGLGNNIDFLSALMQHRRFRSGALTTGFIAEEYPEGFAGAPADAQLLRKLAAVATVLDLIQASRAVEISGQLATPTLSSERVVLIGGERFDIIVDGYDGGLLVNFDPNEPPLDIVTHWQPGQRVARLRIDDDAVMSVGVKRTRSGWMLRARGASHDVKVYAPRVAELARHMIEKIPPDMSRFLLAPMPGLLTR
ncbi:MAG: biotin carboxylase N-terminal domain-containing protein, partial [Brevundimonas sp.]|uniref:ATP-binding protein n=1 Tax=Brevundimonas sp. TaxID=1871086 RepID=UPI002ABD06A9